MTDPLLCVIAGAALLLGLIGTPGSWEPRRRWAGAAARLVLPIALSQLAAWALLDVRYYEAPVWSVVVGAMGGAVGAWWAVRQLPEVWGSQEAAGVLAIGSAAAICADTSFYEWLRLSETFDPDPRPAVAGFFQGTVVLPLIGTLTRALITEMQTREAVQRRWEEREDDPDVNPAERTREKARMADAVEYAQIAWFRIIGLGVAATVVVLEVAAQVVARGDLDKAAEPPGWQLGWLYAAAAVAVVAVLVARALAPGPRGRERLHLGPALTTALVFTACAWGVVPHLLVDHYNEVNWVIPIAATFGLVTLHSIRFHAADEHAAKLGPGGWLVAVAWAAASGSALFWLMSAGLWEDGRPVAAPEGADIAIVVLVATGLLVGAATGAISRARPTKQLSLYPPQQGISNDVIVYAGIGVVLGAIPALLVGHFRHTSPSDTIVLLLITATAATVIQATRFGLILRDTIRRFLAEMDKQAAAMERRDTKRKRKPNPTRVRHHRVVDHHFTQLPIAGLLIAGWTVAWIADALP
jgi:hypothetical protein